MRFRKTTGRNFRIYNYTLNSPTAIPPMPSTHLSLHYHLIFGTKNHAPTIHANWRRRLHAYLGGIIKTLKGVPESVGGVADHVHMLVGLRATHTLADVLRDT